MKAKRLSRNELSEAEQKIMDKRYKKRFIRKSMARFQEEEGRYKNLEIVVVDHTKQQDAGHQEYASCQLLHE